jgi:hypothetical protein
MDFFKIYSFVHFFATVSVSASIYFYFSMVKLHAEIAALSRVLGEVSALRLEVAAFKAAAVPAALAAKSSNFDTIKIVTETVTNSSFISILTNITVLVSIISLLIGIYYTYIAVSAYVFPTSAFMKWVFLKVGLIKYGEVTNTSLSAIDNFGTVITLIITKVGGKDNFSIFLKRAGDTHASKVEDIGRVLDLTPDVISKIVTRVPDVLPSLLTNQSEILPSFVNSTSNAAARVIPSLLDNTLNATTEIVSSALTNQENLISPAVVENTSTAAAEVVSSGVSAVAAAAAQIASFNFGL